MPSPGRAGRLKFPFPGVGIFISDEPADCHLHFCGEGEGKLHHGSRSYGQLVFLAFDCVNSELPHNLRSVFSFPNLQCIPYDSVLGVNWPIFKVLLPFGSPFFSCSARWQHSLPRFFFFFFLHLRLQPD